MDFIFKVDPIRRNIKVPDGFTVLTMDHNVHKLVFVCPYYEDFAFDSASIVFMVDAPDGKQYIIPAEEYESFPNSPAPYVKFTLTLKSYITSVVGYMSFCITADIISSGNVIEKSWHSKNITISIGGHIDNDDSEDIPEEDVPTINQRLNNLDSKVGRLQTTVNGIANGTPPTASSTSEMDPDESTVYINTTDGNWYYYDGSAWQIGGQYGGAVTSTTFTEHGVPADDFAVGQALDALDDRVTALESGSSGGLTADIKSALLACFANVAWAGNDGQDYYNALDAALNPPANLSSITAVYTQSGTVYDTASLDSLKPDLVVTAHYDNATTQVITNYTLSGNLTEGTSTITVSYGGKTTTFTVTVAEYVEPPLYSWDFTNGNLTDSVAGLVAETTATQDANGIKFSAADKYLVLNPSSTMSLKNKKVEIDIASMSNGGSYHSRLFSVTTNSGYKTNADANSFMWKSSNDGWYVYSDSWSTLFLAKADYPGSYFSGKTLVLTFDSSGYPTVSVDGTDLLTYDKAMARTGYLVIGGSYSDQLYRLAPTISGVRIYEGV